MRREARRALRAALDAGPNPYAQLDIGLATRLGGAIWLIGVLYALVVLPLAPPPGGAPAWVATAAILAGGTVVGVWLLRRDVPLDPRWLLVVSHLGVLAAV